MMNLKIISETSHPSFIALDQISKPINTGLNISQIFYLPELKNRHFYDLLVQNIEENFAQIHLPNS